MTRLVSLLLLCVLTRTLAAQGETSTIVLEHPASARAMALGDAMVAVHDGDASLFTNPALMDATRGASGSLSGQRYLANSSLASASGSVRTLGGTLGAGLRGLNYGSVAEYVPDTTNFGGQRGIATGRDVSASEFAITIGYARAVGGLRVGAAAGYVRQQIADAGGGAASLDVGLAADLAHGVVLAVAVQHLGADLRLATTASPLPRRGRIGASFPVRMGPLGALVTAEGVVRQNGDMLASGGGELAWRTGNGISLVARGGIRGGPGGDVLSRYTYGAGLAGGHVALDYAYQGMGALEGGAHRVGVRYQR